MGILNLTPDSFYDGGKYFQSDAALEKAYEMIADGAGIIDIGAESTRPGSERIPAEKELERILPILKVLRNENVLISIDT
ncbi:MAG: dihydropteroate synthase, partial [Bacteroidetes bacterium]|nr:dihydropteroate synthase [Bacteroidota bacterium]